MRKITVVVSGLLLLFAVARPCCAAETTIDYSVEASATVHTHPGRIVLHWPQDSCATPQSYTIYRKDPEASSWGRGTTIVGTAKEYVDSNVTPGTAYEYQIVKNSAKYNGYGYVCAGLNLGLAENRGRLLLVVDRTQAKPLAKELSRLEQDLVGDGWQVTRLEVSRSESVTGVKGKIKAQYDADPQNVKAVFLFGHVPVAYSGDIVPDGHTPDHRGAWPCDGFYGDMDGVWTDSLIKDLSAAEARNRNIPGDGKFDQSTFPAALKLMVGRVDLANMPGRLSAGGHPTFPSETELLRNYLNKDHAFRHKELDAPRRGVVGDYFGVRDGEAFAASGWRNLGALFGAENVSTLPQEGTWIPSLTTNSYLWAYGCGPGSFTSIGGLGNSDKYHDGVTTELFKGDIKAVFTMLFGSWLGDWDSEDNFQRAVLALPSYGLTCACSGRPHWFFHHMAVGQPIGYSARLTQNNRGLYQNQQNNCMGQVHIALMGDPTLRMHVVAPPSEVTCMASGNDVALRWKGSAERVEGYHIYRAANPAGPFERLTASMVKETAFVDSKPNPVAGTTYMVRAVKLENASGGTYYNASQGAFGAPVQAAVVVNEKSVAAPAPTGKQEISEPERPAAPASSTGGATNVVHALSPTGLVAVTNETVWVNDSLPAGAVPGADGGDSWTWVSANPAPFSGAVANQSTIAAGMHQHYFSWATAPLTINAGDTLIAYVYLPTGNTPSEIMLQWFDGSWNHRAYWGANSIAFGTNGTVSQRPMGAMPGAGAWARLEVPASQVGLEGSTLTGMAFTQFGGQATWDYAGKAWITFTNVPDGGGTNDTGGTTNVPASTNTALSLGTNVIPGLSVIDYMNLALPAVGTNALHVLSPTLLELRLINTMQLTDAQIGTWNLVNSSGQFFAPANSSFTVTANGQTIAVTGVGFKRRPLYLPFEFYDLRVDNSLYLQLASPVADSQTVEVKNPGGSLWPSSMQFIAGADPLRFSPAIHVNQEGYLPNYPKKAMVGYYLGNLGEMTIPTASGFKIVDAHSGAQVFSGSLTARPDVGWIYSPTPYQKVYEADFTGFNTPGQYRLQVPGLGASVPFAIDTGIAMDFARGYALGLYHQRCGTNTAMPFTRFEHGICHNAPVSVPWPAANYTFTWNTIAGYGSSFNADNPPQTAPPMSATTQLFPFVRQGTLDTTGGHHDAGDYSKYTINCASFVHYLMFSVDSLPGVAALDNLGIPESGDGISDVMQEAKWEADYVAKLQDTDGGFYFLVYPMNREYESGVTPDHGDAQVVWPKTTSVTAASVAALAQCASSPTFKRTYPAAAAAYLQKAQLGWQFLTNAIARYGKTGAYQKITHYGDNFADQDELTWAACEMFLATGDQSIHQLLKSWFDPSNPATWRWGWWHMSECYGHAIRSYAFAARSGRLAASALDSAYLAKCQTEIAAAGDAVLNFSQESAYGTSFPDPTKRVNAAGWYFSSDEAFDMTVAYQLNPNTNYITGLLANMNYEGGCNPVNVTYLTGMGWKRQRDIVSQWASVDSRTLPPSGIPEGNVQAEYAYLPTYGPLGEGLVFPSDNATTAPYPFYDRWEDGWNVTCEFVVLNSARSLGSLAFLAAQTSLKTQSWHSVAGTISAPTGVVPTGTPVSLTMTAPGIDLSNARITWEGREFEPAFAQPLVFTPKNNGTYWVEAEAQLPDGRRIFARTNFMVNAPNVVWVDDALPAGAVSGSDGGDSWTWVSSSPAPFSGTLANQSAIAAGSHQHYFANATATLAIGTGDVLYAYVYIDPNNRPSELMLQWNDGSWEHRAYWGGNSLGYGIDGTASRRYMGALPAAGQWVQLQIPASQVNLEGSTLNGMAFTAYGGRVTWDAAGRLSNVTTTNLNTVSVMATVTNAARVGLTPAVFTVTRSGAVTNSVSVSYALGGNAVAGTDYIASAGSSVTIPAGSNSATVTITPLASTNLVLTKQVVLTVGSGSGYTVGTPANATVTLSGNSVPVKSVQMVSGLPKLTWNATIGKTYLVAYKNNLSDPSWTTIASGIAGTGTTLTWTDNSSSGQKQRFYLIAQTN